MKSNKWKQSSSQFVQNVILEELRLKANKNATLKKQIIDVYDGIRQTCPLFRYLCILKTIVDLLPEAHSAPHLRYGCPSQFRKSLLKT